MDPVTHAAVGAAAASLVAPRPQQRISMVIGALAAASVDLDVLLVRPDDPLFQLEMHRQATHSVLLAPLWSVLVGVGLWLLVRRRVSLPAAMLYAFLGLLSAGLLDACTSYGTQLFWPLSSARIAWNLVPVVEPLVTLGLLALLVLLGRRRFRWVGAAALGWMLLFLGYGAVMGDKAEREALAYLRFLGDHPVRWSTKPTLGNQRLWRCTAILEGSDGVPREVVAVAVRIGPFRGAEVLEGGRADLVLVEREYPELEGTRLYRDLLRFERLSDGYLTAVPQDPGALGDARYATLGDARYAMLATELSPLWGVRFETADPERPLEFITYRDRSRETRERFWQLLWG